MPTTRIGTDFNSIRVAADGVRLLTYKIHNYGRNKKFQYILPDASMQIMNIDGDEFAEADYGLVVDNSNAT